MRFSSLIFVSIVDRSRRSWASEHARKDVGFISSINLLSKKILNNEITRISVDVLSVVSFISFWIFIFQESIVGMTISLIFLAPVSSLLIAESPEGSVEKKVFQFFAKCLWSVAHIAFPVLLIALFLIAVFLNSMRMYIQVIILMLVELYIVSGVFIFRRQDPIVTLFPVRIRCKKIIFTIILTLISGIIVIGLVVYGELVGKNESLMMVVVTGVLIPVIIEICTSLLQAEERNRKEFLWSVLKLLNLLKSNNAKPGSIIEEAIQFDLISREHVFWNQNVFIGKDLRFTFLTCIDYLISDRSSSNRGGSAAKDSGSVLCLVRNSIVSVKKDGSPVVPGWLDDAGIIGIRSRIENELSHMDNVELRKAACDFLEQIYIFYKTEAIF